MEKSKKDSFKAQRSLIEQLKSEIVENQKTISQLKKDLKNKVICVAKNEKEFYIDIYNEKNQFLCSIPLEVFEERCIE